MNQRGLDFKIVFFKLNWQMEHRFHTDVHFLVTTYRRTYNAFSFTNIEPIDMAGNEYKTYYK